MISNTDGKDKHIFNKLTMIFINTILTFTVYINLESNIRKISHLNCGLYKNRM